MSSSFLMLLVIAVLVGSLVGFLWRSANRERPADSPTALPSEEGQARLAELIRSGQTIHAIKLHRKLYGSGLKEAKDAVEAMQEGRAPIEPPRRRKLSDPDANAAIERAIRDNELIEAIKLYRAHHGVGLKEAKDAVEAMRADLLRREG